MNDAIDYFINFMRETLSRCKPSSTTCARHLSMQTMARRCYFPFVKLRPNHSTLLPALTFHLPVFVLTMAASLLPCRYVISGDGAVVTISSVCYDSRR